MRPACAATGRIELPAPSGVPSDPVEPLALEVETAGAEPVSYSRAIANEMRQPHVRSGVSTYHWRDDRMDARVETRRSTTPGRV